jgi:hypothetical protein
MTRPVSAFDLTAVVIKLNTAASIVIEARLAIANSTSVNPRAVG